MEFSYYDTNNQIKKLDIKIGSKWSEIKPDNGYVSCIFQSVDNGDDIVQENEFSIVQFLLKKADSMIKKTAGDGVADDKELFSMMMNLRSKKDTINELKAGRIETIDPNDYTLESLKKRYPEDKYEIEESGNRGGIKIKNKYSRKLVLEVYISKDERGEHYLAVSENPYQQDSINRYYSTNGTLLAYEGTDKVYRKEGLERLLNCDENEYSKTELLEKVNAILAKITPKNIIELFIYNDKEKTMDEMIKSSPLLKNNHYIREKILNHLNKCLEEYYDYKHDFKNENSQVVNKFHTGDSYAVDCKNEKMTIINNKTGKKKTLDLNELVSELPLDKQVQVKKWLSEQPGELLMDLATETDKLKSFLKASDSMKEWAKNVNAAAWYNPATDNITLGASGYDAKWAKDIAHELGHALDEVNDEFLSSKYDEFKEAFKNGQEAFVKAGYTPCTSATDCNNYEYVRPEGNEGNIGSNYATKNYHEMFAECYEYLMTGSCSSAAMLEDFFPDCLRIANEMIEQIRALPDEVRHKK